MAGATSAELRGPVTSKDPHGAVEGVHHAFCTGAWELCFLLEVSREPPLVFLLQFSASQLLTAHSRQLDSIKSVDKQGFL